MKSMALIVAILLAIAGGVRIYDAFVTPNRVICVASEFNFGCFTPLGWAISLAAAVVVVGAICLWERFRGT